MEAQTGFKKEELEDVGGKEKRGNLMNSISNKIQFKVIIIVKYLGIFIIEAKYIYMCVFIYLLIVLQIL